MTNEERERLEYFYNVNRGILLNNFEFLKGKKGHLTYDFDCPEYQTLKEKYNIEEIAGEGNEFTRAKRLLNNFSPRLKHASSYDNHVEENSLALLEYSLDNPKQGINCLAKAKIFAEMCLALGIKARRIGIMPYSPYDLDNHVVNEIFDHELNKWIMMDLTCNTYFINKDKTPLSMLEIREHFAKHEFITAIECDESLTDIKEIEKKNLETNWYIAKNSFRFTVDKYQGFGLKGGKLYFVPKGFSVKNWQIHCFEYKYRYCVDNNIPLVNDMKEELEKTKKIKKFNIWNINTLKE